MDVGGVTTTIKSDTFQEYCRQQSRKLLASIAKVDQLNIGACELKEGPTSEASWISVIFASSGAIRLVFRAHYIESEIREFVHSARGGGKLEYDAEMAKDFVKEFCNVAAGSIKHAFEPLNKDARMSLPIVTRSADSVFFEARGSALVFEDEWTLSNSDGRMGCSISVEFIDMSALKKILLPAFGAQENDSGDVEFF